MTNRESTIRSLEESKSKIADIPRNHFQGWGDVVMSIMDALEMLKEQPEIVRCRDCIYCKYPQAEKEWCEKRHLYRNGETWFCADGERKEK